MQLTELANYHHKTLCLSPVIVDLILTSLSKVLEAHIFQIPRVTCLSRFFVPPFSINEICEFYRLLKGFV